MRIFAKMIVLGALPAVLAAQAAAQTLANIEARFPECAGMFTQAGLDALARAAEDPREGWEKLRRQRMSLIEEPPLVVCESKIWKSLRGLPFERSAVEAGTPLAAPSPFAPLFAAMVSVGKNVAAAEGVEEYQGETSIAVNPANPQQLVAGANTFNIDFACQSPSGLTYGTQALYSSADGGETWTYQCAPWHPDVQGGLDAPNAIWFGADPSLAWDRNGNAYAAYMLASQSTISKWLGTAIVVAKSTEAGASWSPLGVVINDIEKDWPVHDKPILAIDTSSGGAFSHPNRLYVIWDRENVVRVAHSDDGVNWVVKAIPGAEQFCKGGNLAVGADGTVYAVWNQFFFPNSKGKASPDRVWFSKSTDGGVTWSPAKQILTLHRGSFQTAYEPAAQDERPVNSLVSIGIDRNPESAFFNRLYLTYSDSTPIPEDDFSHIDVYSVHSKDGGDTWSKPVRVNDDKEGMTHFFPWLAVDQSDGAVHIAWYDTRNDPDYQEQVQVYAARSTDGGESFEENYSLMDDGPDFNNQVGFLNTNSFAQTVAGVEDYNPNQYGDYMGIAAADRKVFAFWTDTRQFMPNPQLDEKKRREDAASATVTHCSPPVWDATLTATPTSSGISVSWPAPSSWGTNATGGTYTAVVRYNTISCSGVGAVLPGNPGQGPFLDTPPPGFNYSYKVRARNDCPGTPLTPMESLSLCSNTVSP